MCCAVRKREVSDFIERKSRDETCTYDQKAREQGGAYFAEEQSLKNYAAPKDSF
jgi:predicted SprT family Zn-dependent metalloprotease